MNVKVHLVSMGTALITLITIPVIVWLVIPEATVKQVVSNHTLSSLKLLHVCKLLTDNCF